MPLRPRPLALQHAEQHDLIQRPPNPHNTEAAVNPVTAVTNSRVRPNRAARNPVGAVMIAAATI